MSEINRITYVDAVGRLNTINPDGSQQKTLTERGRFFQFPCWSPDGTMIAAIGSDRESSGVFVISDDERQPARQIFHREHASKRSPFYLYWSPDSKHVSFIAKHPDKGIAFYVVCQESEKCIEVAHGQPFFWQWGMDSAEIMIHAGVGETGQIGMMSRDNGACLRKISNPGHFQAPAISSSNRYLAYGVLDEDGTPIMRVEDSLSGDQLQLPHLGAMAVSWSPTRDQLAFMSPGSNATHFYGPLRLVLPDGTVKPLTQHPVLGFFWSPDGRKLAYFAPSRESGKRWTTDGASLDVVYTNGHVPPRITRPNLQKSELHIELWIIDLDIGSRHKAWHFQPTSLFLNQVLPFFDQYALSHRIWSPKSDALVLPCVINDENQLAVVQANGKGVVILGEATTGFWSQ